MSDPQKSKSKNRKERDVDRTPEKPSPLSNAILKKGGPRINIFGALAECAEDMIDLDISKKNEDGSKTTKPKIFKDLDNRDESKLGKIIDTKNLGNPVYRELAVINGEINRMDNRKLREKLWLLNLDQSGTREVQKNRLKAYYKAQKLKEAQKSDPKIELQYYYDFYVVIDFEATCEAGNSRRYKHEIIEFPAMLVDANKMEIVAEFQSYVKPVLNPQLSGFCTHLTGISQTDVSSSPMFPEVLKKFEDWLEEHRLFETPDKFALVTDGPWDMGRFMFQQCKISKLSYPKWCRQWVNIRKIYSNFYNTRRICLRDMLHTLQMKFQGRPHCGRDDSYNIARIAVRLLKDGANMRPNEEINSSAFKDSKYITWDNIVKPIPVKRYRAKRSVIVQENFSNDVEKELNDSFDIHAVEVHDGEDNVTPNKELPVWSQSKISLEAKTDSVIDCSNTTEFPELISMRLKA